MGSGEIGSASSRLSQCLARSYRARRGTVTWPAGIRSELPQMPGDFASSKCIAYIRLRPVFSGRGDDALPSSDSVMPAGYPR